MKTGYYIKKLRTGNNIHGKKWSQEELGKMLNPPVNRSAINKWEIGRTKSIKKSYIEQLAKIFGVSPSDLMCFDDQIDSEQVAEEVKVIEQVQKYFGKDAVQLLQLFNELNINGRQKALEDLGDLTEHPKYTNSSQTYDC